MNRMVVIVVTSLIGFETIIYLIVNLYYFDRTELLDISPILMNRNVSIAESQVGYHRTICKGYNIDWQPVVDDMSYVYGAHLNPEQVKNQTEIQIIGVLRDTELIQYESDQSITDIFYCRLYLIRDEGNHNVTVIIDVIKRQDLPNHYYLHSIIE